jgi:hypothetical protein
MIKKEILEEHYREYGTQPDEWVENMKKTKSSIIKQVLSYSLFKVNNLKTKVAVLGASDKRYLKIHNDCFKGLLGDVEVYTLDIDRNI